MKYAIVVIGASIGGFRALKATLFCFPGNVRLLREIVQHRRADAGDELQGGCARPVTRMPSSRAPSPWRRPTITCCWKPTTTPGRDQAPVYYERPSIDVMFESVAEAMGAGVIGVVLTGTRRARAGGDSASRRPGADRLGSHRVRRRDAGRRRPCSSRKKSGSILSNWL